MKKAKRPVCIIMTVLILVTAPIAAYNQAQAAEIVGTMELLQALLEMFGVSVGLGTQSDYFSQESFNDFATAVSNGQVYHMDKYGDVDFSDDTSVQDWLEWANGIDEYITTSGWSPMTKYDAAIKSGAVLLDCASYKITGTSATTAMHGYIEELIGDYNGSSEAFAEDIRDTFTVITGGTGNDNDNDDDETKKKRYQTRFACFTGLFGAMILTMGDSLNELVGLKHPETSDFSEYDAAFEENYCGNYLTDTSGQYVCDVFYEAGGGIDNGYKICKYKWHYVGSRQIFGYLGTSGGYSRYYFAYFLGTPLVSNFKSISVGEGVQTNLSTGHGGGYSANSALCVLSESSFSNVPIFSSLDTAIDYFNTGDTSGILNLEDGTAYINYKEAVPSAAARLPKHLDSWIMSPEYLQKLPSVVKPVLDAADFSAGKTDSIDAVEDAIKAIAPEDTEVVDPPVTDNSTDYSGILGKILAAINKIISLLNPVTYVTAFAKKFMTADSLTELLNSLPNLFADAFVLPLSSVIEAIDAISESLVTDLALPDVIRGAIASVFPRVHEVEDAIIEFPDIIAGALSGVVIEVPDIQIPEFTIPDVITIAKLDISELSVPAMANPTIDLTLNPSYDITVTNDYTGLTDIISSAVDGVLTDLFVPDEALAMEKVAEMEAYFKFKDGIITGVIDLKTMLYITAAIKNRHF